MCAGVHPKPTQLTLLPASSKLQGWYLIDDIYARTTHKAYNRGVLLFHQWLQEKNIDATDMKEPQFDRLICNYLHELHQRKEKVGLASLTIYGLQSIMNYPKGSLVWSKKALRGWMRNIPTKSHAPISLPLAWMIAIRLAQIGYYRAGVAIMVAFNGLLRLSEVIGLHREHIILPQRHGHGMGYDDEKHIHLRLIKTKTGNNQGALIDDPNVILILLDIIKQTPNGQQLFPYRGYHLRNLLQQTAKEIGIDNTYVFHSLRHGGATHMWRTTQDIEKIRIRGRWKQAMTARHYVQDWAARFLQVETPDNINLVATQLYRHPTWMFHLAQQFHKTKTRTLPQ